MAQTQAICDGVNKSSLRKEWQRAERFVEDRWQKPIFDRRDQLLHLNFQDLSHDRERALCSLPCIGSHVREVETEGHQKRVDCAAFVRQHFFSLASATCSKDEFQSLLGGDPGACWNLLR